jgi:AcrR family transcriptional regulator
MTNRAGTRRKVAGRTPALETKTAPSQARSQDTYEYILETAGKLLGHMGFEELTTNLICRTAGMTPPALYRYFPNKYAILKILGERLIAAQDLVVDQWLTSGVIGPSRPEDSINRIASVLRSLIAVTKSFPGGVVVNRAIHAVPLLQQLHIESRESVATQLCGILQPQFPMVSAARLHVAARMVSELSAALVQMAIEDAERDPDSLIYETALLFSSYFRALRDASAS